MTDTTVTSRARASAAFDRALMHPLACAATAVALILVFSWTFIANPGRVAPGDDPAFYTWRTESLLSEPPATILETTGPDDVLAGGYRVTTPVFGGLLRRLLGIAPETTTMILTVSIRVLIALLLGGFAFRHHRDPLAFHMVALGSASLLLTPPFFGYLDNLLCLMFLAASLFLLEAVRTSWAARAVFVVLLFLAGMTHPTTLVFFCLVLGAMAALRLITRRLDFASVVREDLPLLAAAAFAAVAVVAVWRLGAWGPGVSLSEAAVPPPASEDFFFTRLTDWIRALRPLLNGPLFAVGIVSLLVAGRRAGENELSRVALAWLLPLVGVFGFLAGLAYPYYRFFNTTLAWVLLVAFGAAVAARFFILRAERAGPIVLVGLVAIGAVFVTNFSSGYPRWNDPDEAWLTDAQQTDFRALRGALEESGDGRPVVFVIDADVTERVRIYGFMKFSANVARHALPHGYLDRGHVYLGDLANFLAGETTPGPNDDYRAISAATLADANSTSVGPVIVVPEVFNRTGANAALFDMVTRPRVVPPEVWTVSDGVVRSGDEVVGEAGPPPSGSPLRVVLVAAGLLLFCGVGLLALRGLLPGLGLAEALGLAPALAVAFLTVTGFVVLALARAPLSPALAWITVVLAAGAAALIGSRRGEPAVLR